jgi:arylsulfatase A-like enzyme
MTTASVRQIFLSSIERGLAIIRLASGGYVGIIAGNDESLPAGIANMNRLCIAMLWAVALTGCPLKATAKVAAVTRPHILLILADDLGFSDIGCYGGEIATPNLDRLAASGLRFTQFYNAARCCPSRAAFLTGLYPHQAQVGDMVDEYARQVRETLHSPAYSDRLNPHAPRIAELLRQAGYLTGMSGKWHLGYRTNEWPAARGFTRSFALIEGAMNYFGFGMQHTGVITNPPMALDEQVFIPPQEGFFATDAFTDYAVRFIHERPAKSPPFFFYLAYTAPHWPLHARPEAIVRHRGQYKAIGWDQLREQRRQRLIQSGIWDARWPLAPRPPGIPAWAQATPTQQEQWDNEMAVYAAQIEAMDTGIGKVFQALEESGQADNTVVMFMSDNGGAAEDPNRSLPGAVLGIRESYEGYGLAGAHVSSSPFRKTKKYTHEGGIATPLIIHWPAGIGDLWRGSLIRDLCHFVDILPTCLDLAAARFPKQWAGAAALAPQGISLRPAFKAQPLTRKSPLFWEHEGQRAVRHGPWKLVATFNEPWELYHMTSDRTELKNLITAEPRIAHDLLTAFEKWAAKTGVKPWP